MKLPNLRSFRVTGTALFNVAGVLVIIYLVMVLAETVKRNYDLGRQIDALNAQMTVLKDQRDNLAYSIQYYKTDSFRDREARSQLGLQLPGENVIIVPGAGLTTTPAASTNARKPKPAKSNFQQWLDFFAGRG